MSADNGIYIGKFPTKEGSFKFFVIEASAIDNVYYGPIEKQDTYRKELFSVGTSFINKEMAIAWARILAADI
jgi:hypothetical protein